MPSSHSLKVYFGLAAILGGLALCTTADAQSGLPACPSDTGIRWHECWGQTLLPGERSFVGEFKDGKPNGQGSHRLPDGKTYVGEYEDGKATGWGTLTAPNGLKIVGQWRDFRPHGQVTSTFPDGGTHLGTYKDGKFEGPGTLTRPDGSKYSGVFKDNKREGQGTQTYSKGEKYVGAWKNDKREGQGTYTSPDGRKYVGAWRDGKREGQGIHIFTDGAIYSGMWKDNKREGQGTQTNSKGEKYEGAWKNDKREGQGTYTSPDGRKYVGAWRDGKREGQGTHTWSDGRKYVGAWKADKYEGPGTMYAPNGSVRQMGIWANNKFVRSASVTTPTAAPPPAPPKSSSGSAFRIANGQFVTNHHVVDGCMALKIDGNSGGRVVASDPTRDLALVSIANDSGPIASVRTTRIQLNESITAAGFPLDGAFTGIAITNGTISRLSGLRGDTGEVQISAPVQPGNSGGPLLDVAGNVIGVVSSKLNALKLAVASGDIPQNVNFAINGAALRAFLDAKSVNYKEVSNERELTGVQIAARASAFTVLVECRR